MEIFTILVFTERKESAFIFPLEVWLQNNIICVLLIIIWLIFGISLFIFLIIIISIIIIVVVICVFIIVIVVLVFVILRFLLGLVTHPIKYAAFIIFTWVVYITIIKVFMLSIFN